MSARVIMVAAVVVLVTGTSLSLAVQSTVIHDELVVSVTVTGESTSQKHIQRENIASLSSIISKLCYHPDTFDVYLSLLLQKLESYGLIDDAHQIEELIVPPVKKPSVLPSGNLFLNAYCFMVGHGTNSVVLKLSEFMLLNLLKILFWPTIYIPLLNTIALFVLTMIAYPMIYSPALYVPVGVWDISGEGSISTYGLMGHHTAEIHGGKFGKRCFMFGFKGLSLTLPMGNGYAECWLIGSARAIAAPL